MATDGPNDERPDRLERQHSPRSRAKSLSVGDLRAMNKATFVPDMPAFEEVPESRGRLIVVANRLPITVKRSEDGHYDLIPSAGGLVSGLSGMMRNTSFLWYGWPGLDIPPDDMDEVRQRCLKEHSCIPVFMSEELSDRHYNGWSNSVLWPLFHYHPEGITIEDPTWDGYREANRVFAKTIADDIQDNDLIWVQDYHLMLLPGMLREELENKHNRPMNVKIGFFLHTPFPSSEIYRILPMRNQILEGVLHCDLIGFHTYDYARHFLSSCTRVLGLSATPNSVEFEGKVVSVGTFPIGIDPIKFNEGLQKPEVIRRVDTLRKKFEGMKVIVGVDRLDYIKGVLQKLHAFEVFLSEHPEWIEKVILVQVAVPSRGDVEEYQNLRSSVNELVGRINGRFGTVEFVPIHFLHKSVSFFELMALYSVADVCLVTSTRDGMNLVSFEYVACQEEQHGVLILSEFAGAAGLLNGAIVINPWNADEVAGAIYDAMTMGEEARMANYTKLKAHVTKYTSAWWCDAFITELTRISQHAEKKALRARHEAMDDTSRAVQMLSLDYHSSDEERGREDSSLPTDQECAVNSVNGSFDEDKDDVEKKAQIAEVDDEDEEDDEELMLKAEPKSPPAAD